MNKIISIAPMMDYTDKHFRYLMRLITRRTLLYTEMITSGAILNGDRSRLLTYHPNEHPLALQLGGSEPEALAQCAKIAEDLGYDEINLNVGCPSDRVQNGKFGACLMKEPALVAECIAAMNSAVKIPVTVKTRIGVDDLDSYEYLTCFIRTVADVGCQTFILHARKAWLKGLSPKENREIPPLQYQTVYQLKKDFPILNIIINGGIKTIAQIEEQMTYVDGVMIGREAYHNPYLLAMVDKLFYGEKDEPLSRLACLEQFMHYAKEQLKQGTRLTQIARHLLGLFHGISGAQAWRRYLSERVYLSTSNIETIVDAASFIKNS